MKSEYDFSKAERGKFYRPGAVLVSPNATPGEPNGNSKDDAGTSKTTEQRPGEPAADC